MKAWRFSTRALPPETRAEAWADALNRLCLPVAKSQDLDPSFEAAITCVVSPLGIEFAQIASGPHGISGTYPNQPSSIWIVLLIEGDAELFDGQNRVTLAPGDIAFGPSGVDAALTFETPSRQLFVKIPELALSQRLLHPLALRVGHLSGSTGIRAVFSGLLSAVASSLEEISGAQLRPIELALTELLVTCLIDPTSRARVPASFSPGSVTTAKATQLHQICQKIEALLGHSDLTARRVAAEQGVSVRYLQKLFSSSGDTFGGYVRARRLERCRADLVSPLCADLSITQICYRWGFNASSHFSRSFKEKYGVSPRAYRQSGG